MALAIVGEILKITMLAGLALAGILVILIWTRNKTKRVSYLRLCIGLVSLFAIYYSFTFTIWLLLALIILFLFLPMQVFQDYLILLLMYEA